MKKNLFNGLLLALLVSGCAHLTSTTESTDGSRTSVSCFTFFDSQSALAKFRNASSNTSSNQWSAGTSIGGLNQESSSTNLVNIIGAVAEGVVKGMK
jgi:hypothetical protein